MSRIEAEYFPFQYANKDNLCKNLRFKIFLKLYMWESKGYLEKWIHDTNSLPHMGLIWNEMECAVSFKG